MIRYSDFVFHPLKDNRVQLVKEVKYKDITIPKGYKSDGASIPYIAKIFNIARFRMDYLPCAIIHDYLCDLEQYKKADKYFCECLRKLKISKLTRKTMYYAVRMYHLVKYKQ
jgi:hypothetical protein